MFKNKYPSNTILFGEKRDIYLVILLARRVRTVMRRIVGVEASGNDMDGSSLNDISHMDVEPPMGATHDAKHAAGDN
jgi:hypothetical protein